MRGVGVAAWTCAIVALALAGVTHGFVPHGAPLVRSAGAWGTNTKRTRAIQRPRPASAMRMHKVTIEHEGTSTVLEVSESTTVLDAALDNGIELPHDCKLGVCLTCPSMVVSGEVDQSEGTLEDSVIEQGFALTCCTYPRSDVVIRSVEEDKLVGAQFVTG